MSEEHSADDGERAVWFAMDRFQAMYRAIEVGPQNEGDIDLRGLNRETKAIVAAVLAAVEQNEPQRTDQRVSAARRRS